MRLLEEGRSARPWLFVLGVLLSVVAAYAVDALGGQGPLWRGLATAPFLALAVAGAPRRR